MDTNTVQTLNNLGNKLDGYIQLTATKLGQTADHFWPIFVRQQRIEGFYTLACIIGFIVLACISWKWFHKLLMESCDGEPFIAWGAINVIGTGALIVAILFGGCQAISQVFNPEYAAFQQIIQTVKP